MHTRLTFRAGAQLEGAVQALVVCLVVSVALASSNIPVLNVEVARPARWIALAELAGAALLYAIWSGRRTLRVPSIASGLTLAFVALAVTSAAWSIDARLTIGRAVSLLVLFGAALAIGHGTAGRSRPVGQVLLALLVAVTGVALAGAVELFVRPDLARVPATTGTPLRFNGLGGNPNTMAMLVAVGMPLAVWALVEWRRRAARLICASVLLLLYASVIASGSRGALVGGLLGSLATALALVRVLNRRVALALVGATGALLLAAIGLMEVPSPGSSNPTISNRIVPPAPAPLSPLEAQQILPLENEIGFPRPGAPQRPRRLWDSSGRTDAWRGALGQAAGRPLLGFGFGTEEKAFVDRYYFHYSDRVENAYLGTLLQLGAVGLTLLVALLGLVLRLGWLALRNTRGPLRSTAGAALGVVVAGVVLAVGQSYLTSVGSPATVPFWLSAFLLAAMAQRASELHERERDEREVQAAQWDAEPRLDVVRREDDRVPEQEEHHGTGGTPARQREC